MFYSFLPKLLNMSMTASVVIVCVLLLRLPLKKAPKIFSYALWSVVLFRLLCPISIQSGLSLFGLMDLPTVQSSSLTSSMEYVPENIVHTEEPAVYLPVPGVSEKINAVLPQGREQLVADPLEAPVAIATYVWMLGVLGMAVYGAVGSIRLRRKLLTAVPLRDNIYLADGIPSPFVMGVLRPNIYLPSHLEQRELEYIISHEGYHIRRGDHLVKLLAFLALSLHWFNPLVWVAFFCAGQDMEMSCDEAVVKRLGEGIAADYAASLLSLSTGRHVIAGMPLAFGEGDTKGRIRNLANWKKPAIWVVLLAAAVCVGLAVGLLTNPEKDNDTDWAEDGFFLLIGEKGVKSIEISTPKASGAAVRADSAPFEKGEKVWLEQLQGIADLRGVTITALGAEGEILYEFSVPEEASDEVIAELIGADPWLLAPSEFLEPSGILPGNERPYDVVTWTYSPMMSATWHGAFHIYVEMDYTHVEASCDDGVLWNLSAPGQPRGDKLRFEAGQPVCWDPGIVGEGGVYTAKKGEICLTVYRDEEILYTAALELVQTGSESGRSTYEAWLSTEGLLALRQNPDNMGAALILPDNTAIAAYTDLNYNRVSDVVYVRETQADMLYELFVVENGVVIWSAQAGPAHTGWNTIMLYSDADGDCLVEYRPSMFQGVGSYVCRVFSLENGEENVQKEWSVEFELPVQETTELKQFAQEVGLLLRNCSVLLSTEQGIVVDRYAAAADLPQLYPVRFDPDEIQAAVDGVGMQQVTSQAAHFPEETLSLVFASGAGAWGTELRLEPDGRFSGSYHDSDMGDNTQEYPGGVCYISVFEGRFTDIKQISDHAWSMQLSELSARDESGETWIEDGVRYIAAEPHGVADGGAFVLYAPGTPADELTADCRSWWPDAWLWRQGEQERLDGWGLYNVSTGAAFFTDWN